MIGIYKIENIINGKVYVGQSVNIKQRWAEHRSMLRNNYHENQHLQNAWNKYGEENFIHSIIEECTQEQLNEREKYWMDYYESYKREKGYNISMKENGVIYNPILQFDLSGNFIKEWNAPSEAARITGICVNTIYGCLNKQHKNAGKYIWIRKTDYENDNSLSWYLTNQVYKNVLQYDLDGNLIKQWNTLSEAVKEYGSTVAQCCVHETLTAYGYIWKYTNDPIEIDGEYLFKVAHRNRNGNKPFLQLDNNGNVVREYYSLKDATELGYSEQMIYECYNGKKKKYKGYIWCLVKDKDKYTLDVCRKILDQD